LIVSGTDQADILVGGYGNDTILGGDGDDVISGSFGDDIVNGGAGNNTLTGGSGADVFQITADHDGFDTITDFSVLQGDTLDIKDVLQGFVVGSSVLSDFVNANTEQGRSSRSMRWAPAALPVVLAGSLRPRGAPDQLIVVHP
jgi:Ca2+-binding RTX toxin-like protein